MKRNSVEKTCSIYTTQIKDAEILTDTKSSKQYSDFKRFKMDVINDYKSTLKACLSENNLDYAQKLIDGFHKAKLSPDTECLYLESAYHYYSANYVFALYYADLCFMKDKSFEPTHEIIHYLTEFHGDFSDYRPTFTKDVSCYNRQLNILGFNGYPFFPVLFSNSSKIFLSAITI